MKNISKREVKNMIKDLNTSKNSVIGFEIINNKIELVLNKRTSYRIDGYINRWETHEDTLQEAVERIYDYMNEVIYFHNKKEV
jgi:alpha-L-fucosidase